MQITLQVPTAIKKALNYLIKDDYHNYKKSLDNFISDKKQNEKTKFLLHTCIYAVVFAKSEKYISLINSYDSAKELFEPTGLRLSNTAFSKFPSRKPRAQILTDLGQNSQMLSNVQLSNMQKYFPKSMVLAFLSETTTYAINNLANLLPLKTPNRSAELAQLLRPIFKVWQQRLKLENIKFKSTLSTAVVSEFEKNFSDILLSNLTNEHSYRAPRLDTKDFLDIVIEQKLSPALHAHILFNKSPEFRDNPTVFKFFLNQISFKNFQDYSSQQVTLFNKELAQTFLEHCVEKNWDLKTIKPRVFISSYHEEEEIKNLYDTYLDKQLMHNSLSTQHNLNSENAAPTRVNKI